MEHNCIQPILLFLSYQAGPINKYDKELITYCHNLNLDPETILAIYFAQRKEDISQIMDEKFPYNIGAYLKILQLKKLSAYEKFIDAYGITSDNDVSLLLEKRSIWS